ncbi:MAG: serine/threonine protein kinase, CMGC, CDC2/CDK sub [Chaenotheca gracillima]|nr:MAG: serine/threonine protein kinase, CMGC, CDC2/CDK sub [Chaenotheca gracillima]
MASLFGRLKGNTGVTSPSGGGPSAKKDPAATQITPLQRLLEGAGPIREDGSDKFWGMENFGNTCYCNSILQCLYYSVPFREHVLNYPARSPLESLQKTANGLAKINTATGPPVNGLVNGAQSPSSKVTPSSPVASPTKKSAAGGPQGTPGNRPEDKPDTPEYKKKHALLNGPVLGMDYGRAIDYGMSESIFTSLKDVFEAIVANQSRTGVVSPKKLIEVLKRDHSDFRSPSHQDAHEFLNLLLNSVVQSVEVYSAKGDESQSSGNALTNSLASVVNSMGFGSGNQSPNISRWVHELFEGTLTSETKCLTCENVSQRDEVFLDLSVDLDEHSSVTSCLRKFSEEEMLCERNKFHCDKCAGLQEAEKRMKIKRLPRILAFHLKRFKYTDDYESFYKLFHRVVYPYTLRLFNTTDDAEDPDRLYELYAVVVHIGSGPNQGHYVSIIKTKDRGWLLFDDEMVEPVHKSFVENFFGGKGTLACAYVLFYQETTLEEVQREQAAEGLAANKTPQTAKDGAIIKPTGIPSGSALSPTQSANSPILADHEHFASLDHAATAPPQSPGTVYPPIPTTDGGAPAAVSSPLSSPKKPIDSRTKKEEEKRRKDEEKRARQAEKEAEKERREAERLRLRERLKETENARKAYIKEQEAQLKAATAASLASKVEDDNRLARERGEPVPPSGDGGSKLSSGLGRFKSMRGRSSKLFKTSPMVGSKGFGSTESPDDQSQPLMRDGSDVAAVDSGDAATAGSGNGTGTGTDTPQSQRTDSQAVQQPQVPMVASSPQPDVKKSNRFSLRKRSSQKLL